MAINLINIGTSVNKGDGDPLRTAFEKINNNFTSLQGNITDLTDGIIVSDIRATDSTLLVDATNGTINAAQLTGAAPSGVVDWSVIGNKPTSIAGYGLSDDAYTKAQVDQLVSAPGDIKGSVFADDSTLLVDGVNGTIPAANITGSLSGVAVSTADITGYGVFTGTEESFATLTGATGTVAHDCDNGHIFYHTTPAADWTANFTNLGLTAEHATTLSIVIDQGATAYIPSAVEIGGVAQTLLWQGGSAPSGTADGTDVVAFSILNDGGTYVVMGQLVGFS